jgi:hypothetical protein
MSVFATWTRIGIARRVAPRRSRRHSSPSGDRRVAPPVSMLVPQVASHQRRRRSPAPRDFTASHLAASALALESNGGSDTARGGARMIISRTAPRWWVAAPIGMARTRGGTPRRVLRTASWAIRWTPGFGAASAATMRSASANVGSGTGPCARGSGGSAAAVLGRCCEIRHANPDTSAAPNRVMDKRNS